MYSKYLGLCHTALNNEQKQKLNYIKPKLPNT